MLNYSFKIKTSLKKRNILNILYIKLYSHYKMSEAVHRFSSGLSTLQDTPTTHGLHIVMYMPKQCIKLSNLDITTLNYIKETKTFTNTNLRMTLYWHSNGSSRTLQIISMLLLLCVEHLHSPCDGKLKLKVNMMFFFREDMPQICMKQD